MLDNICKMDYRKLYKCFSESQINSMYDKVQKMNSAQNPHAEKEEAYLPVKSSSTDDLSRVKVALPTTIDAVRARRIERALKSKMKLLHQSGPNCFIVQTESGCKYRVMIGLQTCNCNRGYFCSHLLFVMLQVLNVSSRDAILWNTNLKNFEVEQLIKSYEEKSSDPKKRETKTDTPDESGNPSSNEGTGDEESCPICLQNMDIGEKLVICRGGCNNKLHHECMQTWALEQEKRKERLMCPLCRFLWHDIDSFEYTGHGAGSVINNEVSEGPYEDPWLQPLVSLPNTTLSKEKKTVPVQHRSLSRPWVQMFGSDFVKGLFSKEWTFRETALRWLGQLVISLLQERKAAVELNGQSVKITTLQECLASLVCFMIADPVHKVYMMALAVTQAVTIFSAPETKSYLSFIFQPVFEAIFIRCTDPTRRTYLNSSDYLVYLCRYEENNSKFGGVDYLFSFSLNTHTTPDDWRWWLGRLRVVLRLLTERPLFFTLPEKKEPQVKDIAPRRSAYGDVHLDNTSMHKRLFKIIEFTIQGMVISHFGVRKTGSRVLRESIRRASMDPDALMEIKTQLTSLGRNSNPMLTIYASVLREEALKSNKQRTRTEEQYSQMMTSPQPSQSRGITSPSSDRGSVSPDGGCVSRENVRSQSRGSSRPSNSSTPENSYHRNSPDNMPRFQDSGFHDNNFHRNRYQNGITKRRGGYFDKPPNIDLSFDFTNSFNSQNTTQPDLSFPLSRSSSSYSPTFLADSPASSSHYNSPITTPRTLIIESEVFKFDNVPSCSTTPCSNVPTPDTVKHITNSPNINHNRVSRSSSQLFERAKPERGLIRSSSQLIGSSNCFAGGFSSGNRELDYHNRRPSGESHMSRKPDGCHVMKRNQEDPTGRGKRKMSSPRPQSLPTMETLFQDHVAPSLAGNNNPSNSPSPSEGNTSSNSSSNSGKKNLRADEDYELAIARAKNLSLGQTPLPEIPAFIDTDDVILYSPNGQTNGSYIEGVHWKRGQQIGVGGCSTCYCAWDLSLGQLMCVKQVSFMRNTETEQSEVIDTVREEIAMMRQLSHRNITRLIGAIQLDGHFNIFVEWMPGGSISGLLDKYGAFNEKITLNYTQQIILAVDYLHTNRFLHRDLKGANCFVDSTGRSVRVGDFGTTAKLHASITPAGQFRGELLGTVAFMAPEVLRGEDYGRHCDIWSVGCCILEMVEGKPPWNARDLTNHLALIYKIASASVSPPIPEHISPPTKDLIHRCLESNPADRASASELLTHAVFTRLPHLNFDN